MTDVPSSRGEIEYTDSVLAAKVVSGTTWADVARNHNWVAGRGMQLVPCYCPGRPAAGASAGPNLPTAANDEYAFRFWSRPRYQAFERRWSFSLGTSGNPVSITLPDGFAYSVGVARSVYGNFATLTEVLSSQSSSDDDMTLKIEPNGADVYPMSIGCVEVPRVALLDNANDEGTDLFRAGQPILRSKFDNVITGAASADLGRRQLLNWAVPYHDGNAVLTTFAASSTNSATYDDVWTGVVPVLARRDGSTATTGSIKCRMYAAVSGGTGTVRISSDGSANTSSTVNVTTDIATGYGWTDEITLSVDCDDLDTYDGLQSARFDGLMAEMQAPAGQTIYVASVAVWED